MARRSVKVQYAAPVVVAAAMSFISSRYLFVGSGLNLIPWGLLALVWGVVAKDNAEARRLGTVYGFSQSFLFLWIDNTGHNSVGQFFLLLAIISLLSSFAAACGAVTSLLMHRLTSVWASRSMLILGIVNAFILALFLLLTTQVHAIRAVSPWANDPYDLVVSYAYIVFAVIAAAAALRVVIEHKWQGVYNPLVFLDLVSLAVVAAASAGWAVNGGKLLASEVLLLLLLVSAVMFGLLLIAKRAEIVSMHRQSSGLNAAPFTALRQPGVALGLSVLGGTAFTLWHAIAEGPWANLYAPAIFTVLSSGAILLGIISSTRVLKII
jgi:hypothetical protein